MVSQFRRAGVLCYAFVVRSVFRDCNELVFPSWSRKGFRSYAVERAGFVL